MMNLKVLIGESLKKDTAGAHWIYNYKSGFFSY